MRRRGIPDYSGLSVTTVDSAHSALMNPDGAPAGYNALREGWEEAEYGDELGVQPDQGA